MDGAVVEGRFEPASYAAWPPSSPLKVGVLVDLTLSQDAGGHVKCWERIAEAAIGLGDRLDLTVHFNGPALASGSSCRRRCVTCCCRRC